MKHFNESEFNEFDKMDKALLIMLDNLREVYGYPIKLTSTYRSPEHPIEARKTKPGEHAHGAAVEPNRNDRTSTTPLLVPTITPSRSILLQTSYHCIDSIVKAVADFPRYDINTLITHHMDNWDRNFSRSQRSSQCRSPRSETQAIPPTALILSSSSIQIDHPAVVEAKLIIKHCIDTTYDDVAGILPTIKSFCYVFHSDQDALAKKMVSKCIQTDVSVAIRFFC